MSLPVLAALVVVGIALIVLAIHLTGGSRPASLQGEKHARDVFASDHPNRSVLDVFVTTDGRSAVLQLDGGRIGLVHTVGAKFLTRIYAARELATTRRDGERVLMIRPADFTFSGGRFEFASRQAADSIVRLLADHDRTGRRAA